MHAAHGFLLAVCIAAVIIAGCTNASPSPSAQTPAPSGTIPPASPAVPQSTLSAGTTTGCGEDVCSFIPPSGTQAAGTSLRIVASPQRYSPMMSSTPGIGLEPNATGFDPSSAVFSWNASYGQFLSWNAPDYHVNLQNASVTSHGGKLYWTFTGKPASVAEPVVITVSATDAASGKILGTSTVTLAWDGDNTVTVRDIR